MTGLVQQTVQIVVRFRSHNLTLFVMPFPFFFIGPCIAWDLSLYPIVVSIIFSYGEKSHPWLKTKVAQKMRSEEAFKAGKILGCRVIFFDLGEFNFIEDYQKKEIEKKLIKLLEKYKPVKLFTHSDEDPHPDHKAVMLVQGYITISPFSIM